MSKSLRWHISLSPEKYRPLWIPAALIPTALALLNIYLLLSRVPPGPTLPGLLKFFSSAEHSAQKDVRLIFTHLPVGIYLVARVGQLALCMVGSYFTRNFYWVWHNLLLVIAPPMFANKSDSILNNRASHF
jgi:hypothetical protein